MRIARSTGHINRASRIRAGQSGERVTAVRVGVKSQAARMSAGVVEQMPPPARAIARRAGRSGPVREVSVVRVADARAV